MTLESLDLDQTLMHQRNQVCANHLARLENTDHWVHFPVGEKDQRKTPKKNSFINDSKRISFIGERYDFGKLSFYILMKSLLNGERLK